MKSICEEEGIAVFEVQFASQVSFAGADTAFYLEVPPEAAEQARLVLKDTEYEKFIC